MAVAEIPRGDPGAAETALEALEQAAGLLQQIEWDQIDPERELLALRRLEMARRRVDHGTDRAADSLDVGGGYGVDGHANARTCLQHLGRLSGPEASGRITTARALRRLPAVEAAYAAGSIPTAHVRAIARAVSNPRVAEYVAVADPIFAEQAAIETYPDFRRWLQQWESLADADGADQRGEQSHERRRASLLENEADGSVELSATFGALQGAAVAEVLERFVEAEWHADWSEARARLGDGATVADLARTPRQRRADALFEIVRRAAGASGHGRSPVPLVNIVVDQATFEDALRHATGAPGPAGHPMAADPRAGDRAGGDGAGDDRAGDDRARGDRADGRLGDDGPGDGRGAGPERLLGPQQRGRRCQSLAGTPLEPRDVVAAALVGHVRRVVIDADSNVIDLGRKRRLFTGSGRDAAFLQGALRHEGGLRCLWDGCDVGPAGLEVDHRRPARDGGRTDVGNAEPLCGHHNRIKERGFRAVRRPDGEWAILRPDGTSITPAA